MHLFLYLQNKLYTDRQNRCLLTCTEKTSLRWKVGVTLAKFLSSDGSCFPISISHAIKKIFKKFYKPQYNFICTVYRNDVWLPMEPTYWKPCLKTEVLFEDMWRATWPLDSD